MAWYWTILIVMWGVGAMFGFGRFFYDIDELQSNASAMNEPAVSLITFLFYGVFGILFAVAMFFTWMWKTRIRPT